MYMLIVQTLARDSAVDKLVFVSSFSFNRGFDCSPVPTRIDKVLKKYINSI